MSIGWKVRLGITLLISMLAAFAWFTIAQTAHLDRQFGEVTQDMLAIDASGDYALAISQLQDFEARAFLAESEAKQRELTKEAHDVRGDMSEIQTRLRHLLTRPSQQMALDEMVADLEVYLDKLEEIAKHRDGLASNTGLAAPSTGQSAQQSTGQSSGQATDEEAQARSFLDSLHITVALHAQAIGDLTDLDKETERMVAVSHRSAVEATGKARIGTIIATAATAIVLFALAMAANRYILADLRRLIVAVGSLAAGDLATEVPATQRGDELGEVARALEHFRLTAQEKERLQKQEEAELDFAHTVQLAGLPRHAPVLANGDTVDIRGVLVPSRAVSGDFLDYYQMDANRLAVTIGDASGKGVSSAMFAGWVLGTLKSESMRTANPGQCLTATNRRVAADNDSMMFVTTFFGVIDFADGLFSYANAGHVLPYLLSNAGGVRALVADPGLPLGVVEAFDFEWRQTRLEPGDTIVLYTDGVTEAAAVSDEMFGQQRLEDFLSSHRDADCRFLVDTLLEAVQNFARGAPQADDITVLAVRYKDAPQTIVRSA